jgi:GntR family transcriptional repressor for pyruvate dehydrogenase complex
MSDLLPLKKIRKKTIVAQVMDKIRELIASGRFKTGDRIPTEGELAEMLGIGRSSIREAIKVFNYLGVLDSQTAKGTFVCERSRISAEALAWSILLGQDDYYDLIDTRGAIETWSMVSLAKKFAEDPRSADAHLKSLETQIQRMRRAVEESGMEELANADYEFHHSIIDGSENRLFTAVYNVLRAFMYEEIEKSHRDFSDLSTIVQEHQEFIDAVKTGDPCAAQIVVRKHIESIKKRLANVLAK